MSDLISYLQQRGDAPRIKASQSAFYVMRKLCQEYSPEAIAELGVALAQCIYVNHEGKPYIGTQFHEIFGG